MEWFEDDWEKIRRFVQDHHMEGIELGLSDAYDISKIPEGIVEGVHLKFYPMWLDFWRGNLEKVENILGGQEEVMAYYGGLSPEALVDAYKAQYQKAKALKAKYMVFHVCDCPPKSAFTWQFDYSDEEVMKATAELVNRAFPQEEDGPMLLFENLWWPGLTYLNKALTINFLEEINYPSKGYVVDLSHLILTNNTIDNEDKCCNYIKKVIENLGEARKDIKVVHINKTLPKYYMRQNHSYKLEKYEKGRTKQQKMSILREHIQKLDPHMPFDHECIKDILAYIAPEFGVYETNPTTRHELAYFIKIQNKYLDSL